MKAQHTCTRNSGRFGRSCQTLFSFAILLLFFSTAFSIAQATPLSITVTGTDGTPVPNYRWLVEEDKTYNVIPGDTCFNGNTAECQAVNFHKSYMPVIAEGHSSDTMPDLDPTKRYYISVLPDTAGTPSVGHTIGGTKLAAGETNAVITVGISVKSIGYLLFFL